MEDNCKGGPWTDLMAREASDPPAISNLIIAESQPVTRYGLSRLFGSQEGYRVLAETGSAPAISPLCVQARTATLLLGLPFPEMSAVKIISQVKKDAPETRILVLGLFVDREVIKLLMQIGIHGLLGKEMALEELLVAARTVADGRNYFSDPAIAALSQPDALSGNRAGSRRSHASLTEREREIFMLIAQMLDTREIATRLHISVRTVENHRRRIMRKLGVNRSAELVRYAAALGMVA